MRRRTWLFRKSGYTRIELVVMIFIIAIFNFALKKWVYEDPCTDTVEMAKELCWELVEMETRDAMEIAFKTMIFYDTNSTEPMSYGDLMDIAYDSLDIHLQKDYKVLFPKKD